MTVLNAKEIDVFNLKHLYRKRTRAKPPAERFPGTKAG